METPSVSKLKKIARAIKRSKAKFVTCDELSREVGLYPDGIADFLSYFDPLAKMAFDYDARQLLPAIERFIEEAEAAKIRLPAKKRVSRKKLSQYETIGDFIYAKMCTGGILDKNARLSDLELRAMKRLISDEQAKRKSADNKK